MSRADASDDAMAFATRLSLEGNELSQVARSLAAFPSSIRSRGVFFLGLVRIVEARRGKHGSNELMARAGIFERVVPFKAYSHRDFYKLFYLTTRLLASHRRLDEGLCEIARTFFPIFRESILGKTISALMGEGPRDVLPLLAKAYNMSVEGNEHSLECTGPREALWRARVEPVSWYPQIFQGIVQGALPQVQDLRIDVDTQKSAGGLTDYAFRLRW